MRRHCPHCDQSLDDYAELLALVSRAGKTTDVLKALIRSREEFVSSERLQIISGTKALGQIIVDLNTRLNPTKYWIENCHGYGYCLRMSGPIWSWKDVVHGH